MDITLIEHLTAPRLEADVQGFLPRFALLPLIRR